MIDRVEKNRNYTVINNTILNDVRLSWKARGLAAYLLTKPDNWQINRDHLAAQSPDGIASVRSAIKELRTLGYITSERGETPDGKFRWETVLHEVAQVVVAENRPGLVKAENRPGRKQSRSKIDQVENRTLVSNVVVVSTETTRVSTEGSEGGRKTISPASTETCPAPPTPLSVYQEVFERQPSKAQSNAILATVTDCDRWRDICTTWALKTFNPGNIVDLLDVYQNGWKEKHGTNRRNNHDSLAARKEAYGSDESYPPVAPFVDDGYRFIDGEWVAPDLQVSAM